ncbi:choline/ethanolamine kinase family protein [Roseibium litorale]|uniref:choline/ethanolamine kinase family protein n=1 Tax=Roseibium litorale TaxID=2803841 RepID=UPI0031B629AB
MRSVLDTRPELSRLTGAPRQAERLKGLSNSVFGLVADKGRFVLRVPAAKSAGLIDRQGEFRNLECAARAGLAVPPLFFDEQDGLMLMRRLELAEAETNPAELGKVIARLHGLEGTFSGKLDLPGLLAALLTTVRDAGSFDRELSDIQSILEGLTEPAEPDAANLVPSHCDLSPGNVLKTAQGIRLIDFEFSSMAPPVWDLAYAMLENSFERQGRKAFLEGYAAAGGKVPEPSALQDMTQRCDAVSALWALEQAGLGNGRTDFPAFAKARILRMLERARR